MRRSKKMNHRSDRELNQLIWRAAGRENAPLYVQHALAELARRHDERMAKCRAGQR